MTRFSTRTVLLGLLLLSTAGTALALDCVLLSESAALTTVSVTVDGAESEEPIRATVLEATPSGLQVVFGDGEEAVVLGFDLVEGGAQ